MQVAGSHGPTPLRAVHTRRSRPEPPLRILSIGGGTGLSSLLQGLKYYARPEMGAPAGARLHTLPSNLRVELTAVVTVTDDGGSSGRLRRDFDVLPPGDIRSCMVALSEDEAMLSRLFQYRFQAGRGLKGHSFGNLFLTALTQLTGDFSGAIRQSSEVLAISGRIFPSTASNVVLQAKLEDGTIITGETCISKSKSRIHSILLKPQKPLPLSETIRAIEEADLITLGPGSLFTSVVPNLLVQGISEAIARSIAMKAYFCNLMWQPGETMHFRASDHVMEINKHAGAPIVDCVIVNTKPVGAPLRKLYAREQARPVEVDRERLIDMGLQIVEDELLASSGKARHDPHRAAATAISLALQSRQQQRGAAALLRRSGD